MVLRTTLSRKITQARKRVKIRYRADPERVLGARFTRRIGRYFELKDRRLGDFRTCGKKRAISEKTIYIYRN